MAPHPPVLALLELSSARLEMQFAVEVAAERHLWPLLAVPCLTLVAKLELRGNVTLRVLPPVRLMPTLV